MRMAADEFGGNGLDHAPEVEQSRFLRHSRMEDDLQQQVAQLVAQVVRFAALDRIRDLVGFLDRERERSTRTSVPGPKDNRQPDREAQP